jgi:hypothetical protein
MTGATPNILEFHFKVVTLIQNSVMEPLKKT